MEMYAHRTIPGTELIMPVAPCSCLFQVPAWKRDLKRDIPLQNIIIAYRRMMT